MEKHFTLPAMLCRARTIAQYAVRASHCLLSDGNACRSNDSSKGFTTPHITMREILAYSALGCQTLA